MKQAILVGFIVSACAFAAWEAIGPEGGYMRGVVISPNDPNTVYTSTYSAPCRVFRSTDAAGTWVKMGSYSTTSYCMAIGANEYLYSGNYGVYRSTNNGVTWTNHSTGGGYVYDLETHPVSATVFGAGYSYVSGTYNLLFYKSTDCGTSWSSKVITSGQATYGRSVAVDPDNADVIYVGGNIYGTSRYWPRIYKSTDGGANFSEVYADTLGYYILSLAINPANPEIVYAGTYNNGILRSTDAGVTWTKVSTLGYNYGMATSPADPNLVLSGGLSSIYRSTNAGVSWSSITAGLKGNYFYGLAIDPDDASIIYAANNTGFFKSTNTGASWQTASNKLYAGVILDFGIAPSQVGTMYTEFELVGVFKTTDCGTTWSLTPTPSTCGALCAFTVNNTNPNCVFGLEGSG